MKPNVDRIKSWAEFFVGLGERKDVASVGGKHYAMIVKDDFTRRWMYFRRSKSDAESAFQSFLASVRADGIPSLVEIVRSDLLRGVFRGGVCIRVQ